MSRTEWNADESDGSAENRLGDALAALAIEDSAEISAVEAVRIQISKMLSTALGERYCTCP